MLSNGPRSLADNNASPAGKYPWQTSNFDGSRAGQWDNSQGYVGFSHPVYGSITFGRTNSLSFDAISAYDPVASIAFSALGFSNSFPGFGDTETARPNTAFTYRLTYQNFRAAAQAQIGGYDWGNGTQGMYQGQLGADFGPLSLDGILSWAKDAVSLSSFSGSDVACLHETECFIYVNGAYYDPNSVLKATLSNNFGLELLAKYKWNAVTFYGGYLHANLSNPSDDYLTGFPTIAEGIFVPSGYFTKGVYTNAAVTDNAYDINRKLNTVWTGFKWSVWSNLTFAMAFYYQSQNDYSTSPCTGTGAFISSSACAGSQDAISALIDYRPVGRVDLYAGVMLSNVYGGLASGYTATTTYYAPEAHGKIFTATATTAHTQEYDPTFGIRIRF
jgi:predicted porin